MAQRKSGTTSTAKKVQQVSGAISHQNASVETIREQFEKENKRQQENYAKASSDSVLRMIRDIAQNNQTVSNLSTTNKDTIKSYLTGNIYANSTNLIAASRYLYYRSPIYAKMINAYADMYCLDCRQVTPQYDLTKQMDSTKTLKQYNATLDFLDILSVANNFKAPLINVWLEDVSFNLFFHDKSGSILWRVDPSEAVIDSFYAANKGVCYGFAMDMSKWKSQQRQFLIETLGSPLKEMYQQYLSNTSIKYVHVPAEYSMVLKFRTDLLDAIMPPLLQNLMSLANLNDLQDNQANADDLSFYKMIYLPLQTLNSAKTTDEWEITPDLAIQYFKILQSEAIPAGVSSGIVPGDELKTIDFSDSVSDDVNRVEQSQQQILGSSGGVGALLNATKAVNNTALINAALKSESAYVLNTILPQIEAWTNLQLMMNVSNYCPVKYMPVTIYTKEDHRKTLLESLQYSFMYRLAYGTLLGFSERETLAQLQFESQVLKLQETMIYPLQSSYTQTDNTGGRPETPDDELTDSGNRSRNK